MSKYKLTLSIILLIAVLSKRLRASTIQSFERGCNVPPDTYEFTETLITGYTGRSTGRCPDLIIVSTPLNNDLILSK